jgi:hypothetical protein
MKATRVGLLALLVALAAWPIGARANGHTLTLYLSFMPGLSNAGPAGATGQAKLNIGDGLVDLTAQGLAPLDKGEYEVWLVPANAGTWVSLGRFNSNADGTVTYSAQVNQLPIQDYRYLVITVQEASTAPDQPSGQNSIAAAFPNPEALPTAAPAGAGTGTAGTAEAASSGTPQAPAFLPVTGGAAGAGSTLAVVGAVALAGLLALGVLVRRGSM